MMGRRSKRRASPHWVEMSWIRLLRRAIRRATAYSARRLDAGPRSSRRTGIDAIRKSRCRRRLEGLRPGEACARWRDGTRDHKRRSCMDRKELGYARRARSPEGPRYARGRIRASRDPWLLSRRPRPWLRPRPTLKERFERVSGLLELRFALRDPSAS